MDIAQLGYSVDSSGLERGTRALDDNTRAAERTATATEALENRYQAIARRGVEYAESTRGANLSDRALAEAAREAAAGIDTKAQIMARAGTEQERMARRVRTLQEAEARAAMQTEKAARAHALQELNLKKLLGQIDPTISKLDRLAEMEGQLEKALDLGAINPEIFVQYQQKIDATRAATLSAGKASDIMTSSIGGLNLQAVETQQSIAALGRSLVTGQWGQAQASITSLSARTGIMSGMFSTAGLAIGAAGASVGAYAYALNAAERDTSRIANALLVTGNYVGVTKGQVDQLVQSFAELEGVTHGRARNALIAVAESGRIAGDQFEMVAAIAARMEAATGQSLETTISKFEEIGRNPVAALLKLNETEHFLTQAHLDRVDALIAEGDEQAAAAEAARIYGGRLDEVAAAAASARPQLSAMRAEISQVASATLEGAKNFSEFIAAAATLNSERPRWQQFGPIRAFTLMRDMYGVEPEAATNVPRVSAVDSQKESERRAAAEAAERDIERQIERMHGLDTAVNSVEKSFALMSQERQKALVADGSYTALLNRALEEDAERVEAARKAAQRADGQMMKSGDAIAERLRKQIALNEEQAATTERLTATERLLVQVRGELERSGDKTTAAQRRMIQTLIEQAEASDRAVREQQLLQQYEASEASLSRQIALHGKVGRAAAMAFDTAHGSLSGFSTAQKSALMEMAEWLDWLDDMAALEGVWDQIAGEQVKGSFDGMSEYAKQAARNMQSHFADYLFDPFAEGSRGMLRGFSETVRRMMAEAASSKFFEMIGGAMSGYNGAGSGWINAIGGIFQDSGKREYGGPVSRSGMYQVGERNKPELLSTPNGQYLIPGDSGRVDPIRAAPAGRGGAMGTPVVNIQLVGAPEGTTGSARPNSSGGFDLRMVMGDIKRDIASDIVGGGMVLGAMKQRLDVRDRV